ncbi:5266_t:CDS:1, partial [Racocetra persica]
VKTDVPNFEKHFGLRKLVNTIAHEISHCLLANFNLFFGYDHGEEHKKLTKDVEIFL